MYPTKETTRIWVALNLAQRSVFRTIEAALKAECLPPLNWYDILWELEVHENGLRPYELEKQLLFEQSNLSRLLKKMISQDLIVTLPLKMDRRGKVLLISEKGRHLRKQMWEIYGPQIQKLVGGVSDCHDTGKIIDALNSLVEKHVRDQFLRVSP